MDSMQAESDSVVVAKSGRRIRKRLLLCRTGMISTTLHGQIITRITSIARNNTGR